VANNNLDQVSNRLWTKLPVILPENVFGASAVRINGLFYIAGGKYTIGGSYSSNVMIFDPSSTSVSLSSVALPGPLAFYSSAYVTDSRFLLFGGSSSSSTLYTNVVYASNDNMLDSGTTNPPTPSPVSPATPTSQPTPEPTISGPTNLPTQMPTVVLYRMSATVHWDYYLLEKQDGKSREEWPPTWTWNTNTTEVEFAAMVETLMSTFTSLTAIPDVEPVESIANIADDKMDIKFVMTTSYESDSDLIEHWYTTTFGRAFTKTAVVQINEDMDSYISAKDDPQTNAVEDTSTVTFNVSTVTVSEISVSTTNDGFHTHSPSVFVIMMVAGLWLFLQC